MLRHCTDKPLTVCPWNVLMGLSCPSLQTWMHMSVLQEANVLLLCQSTSSAGAVGDEQMDVSVTFLTLAATGGVKNSKSHE